MTDSYPAPTTIIHIPPLTFTKRCEQVPEYLSASNIRYGLDAVRIWPVVGGYILFGGYQPEPIAFVPEAEFREYLTSRKPEPPKPESGPTARKLKIDVGVI